MKIVKCRACDADIVFLLTRKGKRNPVDLDSIPVPEGKFRREWIEILRDKDLLFDFDRHVSHFQTCPHSSKFQKKAKPAKVEKPEPENTQEALL